MENLHALYRGLSKPLIPIPTDLTASSEALHGIRAVIFDIYGTLIASGTGDISLAEKQDRESVIRESLVEMGLKILAGPSFSFSEFFHTCIKADHEVQRDGGADYPEVDILEIWQGFVQSLNDTGRLEGIPDEDQLRTEAVRYECRVNAVWPMPGLENCLTRLVDAGLQLGIVSNAQFYTPIMLEAFTGKSLEVLGFRDNLSVWSYCERRGKPSSELFPKLDQGMDYYGLSPHDCLFVGNDMLNDIWTAHNYGLKTCLFAGDQRSLRLRENDERCQNLKPDLIITELSQLPGLILPH